MKRPLLVLLMFLSVLALEAQELTILHLNDTHSHVDPERSGAYAGYGGAIEQAAYIDSVRNAVGKRNMLLMHAGDFSQGSSYFTELSGDVEIDLLNAAGYDVVCIGNHEFDNGIDELARRIGNLEPPVVCANYDFSGSALEGLVKPFVVLKKAGKRIGVIGLLTDITTVVDKSIAASLTYTEPWVAADRYGKYLKEEKDCDLIICLTHLGYEGEFYTDRMLAADTRHVDVIVGGHSHTRLEEAVYVPNKDGRDVVVVTDWKWGISIGKLTVSF